MKDWTTNTWDSHIKKILSKHLPSPFSLFLAWQPAVPSRNHPPSPSQETQGEARAHPKQWGRGSSQPAAPAAQAEPLLHTPQPCWRGNTNIRSTKGLLTQVTGCVTSALDAHPNLGTCWLHQTPLHKQGLSSDGCQLLHWTSQVQDPEAPTASQGQKIRQGEEAASGAAANMHAQHQTGAYKTHCWPPCYNSQARAGRKPKQVQTTALWGHLQPAVPNTHLTFDRLGSLPKLHLQELERRDHGPDVADVSALELLGGQGCARQSCQGAQPRQRASRQRRVGDLPWHHSRGNSSLGCRETQTAHYKPATGPHGARQTHATVPSATGI